ncbi:MAG: caspase family protein [Simkaniaceae bacterium]|nr:MAG: caspase family protein [Simkaniaceae bacterium]
MNEARERNMQILKANGYEVTLFKTNREFLDHIKTDPSQVDLLVISGHGSPNRIEDLKVQDGEIISTDPTLCEEEQQTAFSSLRPILKDDSIVFFDACLTGNKTVERNIAMVASRVLPQSTIYASQHVTNFEPGFILKQDEQNKDWGVVSEIYFGYYPDGKGPIETVDPTVYRSGVETTNQEAVPIPPVQSRARRSSGWKPYVIGAMAVAAVAAAVGFGSWWYSKSS